MNTTARTTLHAALYCTFATATLGFLTTAIAADLAPPTKTVRFDDLNIDKPAGAKTLYRRIQAAAREVCRTPALTNLRQAAAERACIDRAVDGAVRSVDTTTLTELRFGTVVHLASR